MAGNTNGNILGVKPVVGSKPDSMYRDTVISLLKRLQNQSGLGGFDFGFDNSFDVFNEKSSDKIGYLQDLVVVPYEEGVNSLLAFAHTAYYHMHGTSFTYPKHANAVALLSAAGVWATTGLIIEVIPANILFEYDFDLHWLSVSAISANLEGMIDIYAGEAGSEILIGEIDISRSAVQSLAGQKMIQVPQQVKNTRISCKFSDNQAGANTCAVKLNGHYYGVRGESPTT